MGGGLFKPKHPILGADIAGYVESVGHKVTQFKPGDEVFGEGSYGGFAEYVCVEEQRFIRKPERMSFEEAAALPMATLTALQGLRDYGKIKPKQKVLVNGASGGVGSFAVQIAKSFGAEVTGVCSTSKMNFVRTLGADHIIDYTREDITKRTEKYDLILDIAAYRSVFNYKRILKKDGQYVIAGGSVVRIFQVPIVKMFGNKNFGIMIANINQKDLQYISELYLAGKLKSFIDKRFPLNKTADAVRYLEEGHAIGKVVVINN